MSYHHNSPGCGFLCILLGVLFIGLRLAKIITWSWWWVLSPLWIPAVIGLAFSVVAIYLSWRAWQGLD